MNGRGKGFLEMIFLLFTTLFLLGFTPTPTQPEKQKKCVTEWVMNPRPAEKDGIYGVGMAENGPNSKKAADARAIDEVVRSVQSKVSGMVTDFLENSGVEYNLDSVTTSVNDDKSEQILRSQCKIVKREICPDGTYISLAIWPSAKYSKQIKPAGGKAKKPSAKDPTGFDEFKANEKAEFEKFKSDQHVTQ